MFNQGQGQGKTPFTFGSSQQQQQQQPGANSNQAQQSSQQPSFGQQPSQQPSLFSFGSNTPQTSSFQFGAKPAAAPTASMNTGTVQSQPTFQFGTTSNLPQAQQQQQTQSQVPNQFKFGAAPATPAPSSSTTATAPPKPLSFGTPETASSTSKKVETEPTAPTTTTSGTPATTAKPLENIPKTIKFPSNLKNKTLEEIVGEWSEDLNALVTSFEKQAVEIAQWDKKIVHNGELIVALNDRVAALEAMQKQVDYNLSHVVAQQSELESLLDGVEKELPEMQGSLSTGNAERTKVYSSAVEAQNQVIFMANKLSSIIYELNGAIALEESGGDPMIEVNRLLNEHLDALKWIEGEVEGLEDGCSATSKSINKVSKDLERLHSTA